MSTISAGTTSGTALVSAGNTDGTLQLRINGTTPSVTLATTGAVGVGSTPGYGTSGQVLTSAGSAAAPTWTTPTAAAMVLISTQTASASASLNWTGLSTYSRYMLILDNIRPATANASLQVQIGTGATPTYVTTGYSYGVSSYGGTAEGNANGFLLSAGNFRTAAPGLNGSIFLVATAGSYPGYTVTDGWYNDVDSVAFHFAGGGRYNSIATVTAYRLIFDTGNISAGTATLYGITS